MKEKIYLALGGLVLIAGIFASYKFVSTSAVVVEVNSLSESVLGDVRVSVDGKNASSVHGTQAFSTSVSSGAHELLITSPCYKDVAEKFSTGLRSKKTFKPSFKDSSSTETAKRILDINESVYTVTKATYYGNCDWLAVFASPIVSDVEGFAAIARFKDGEWVVITKGTALYLESSRPDAPKQLLIDLTGVIEG